MGCSSDSPGVLNAARIIATLLVTPQSERPLAADQPLRSVFGLEEANIGKWPRRAGRADFLFIS
jgi:hypothetical protein